MVFVNTPPARMEERGGKGKKEGKGDVRGRRRAREMCKYKQKHTSTFSLKISDKSDHLTRGSALNLK